MKCALVQVDPATGIPGNRNLFASYEGFSERGIECRFFVPTELPTRLDELAAEGMGPVVAGTIPVVRAALGILGIPVPSPLDYPSELQDRLGRRIWRTTLGAVRRDWRPESPLFVKTAELGKAFTGHLIAQFNDLLKSSAFPDDLLVWASEPLPPLRSEFRAYVLRGEVVGVKHYAGDYEATPRRTFVEGMVADWRDAPVAYALDVGIADDREVLVEANDAYALGNYGLPSVIYAQLVEARWEEFVLGRQT